MADDGEGEDADNGEDEDEAADEYRDEQEVAAAREQGLRGQIVAFGDYVQLRHRYSGRLVSVSSLDQAKGEPGENPGVDSRTLGWGEAGIGITRRFSLVSYFSYGPAALQPLARARKRPSASTLP